MRPQRNVLGHRTSALPRDGDFHAPRAAGVQAESVLLPGDEDAHSWHGVLCEPMAGGLSDEARWLVTGLWVVPRRLLRSPMADRLHYPGSWRAHNAALQVRPVTGVRGRIRGPAPPSRLYGNLDVSRRVITFSRSIPKSAPVASVPARVRASGGANLIRPR